MKKRLKLKSYPMSRCGTMCAETKRAHTIRNSKAATCVQVSQDLRGLDGEEFAAAARDAIRAAGFIFGGATA
jgi:hypothetical protein